jgi:hypothetical protein
MALSFTRAVAVEEGFRPTSTQLKTLARAFNDRLRGFSFASWRIAWFWFNLFRQVRNPDTSGYVFPPQAEFDFIYKHLDPENAQGTTWPEAGPGEPEGANLASPMNQFVYGVDPILDAEDVRLNFGIPFLLTATPTLEQVWELGKAQRGVYDPISGGQSTPAWDAANALFQVQQPFWSPHGKALGGWLPTPVELLPDCGATETTGLGIPSYEIKFTGLGPNVSTAGLHGTITTDPDGNPIVTYAGSCACGTDNVADGHVVGYSSTPFGWIIAVLTDAASCTYALDRFPIADWVEGPYTGEGVLAHTTGNQLQRALWAFGVDFRGTPAQRTPDTFKIKKIGFDNQEFFARQHALAPNVGTIDGDSLLAIYPRATWTGNVPQGTFGTFADNTTESHYRAGFVLAGVFAAATNLSQRVQVAVLNDTQQIAMLDLVPDATGTAQAMAWLKVAVRPEPLRLQLASDLVFAGAGTLYCETTEQIEYKPQFQDAALLVRFGASQGGDQFGGGVDGRGLDWNLAKEISDNYLAQGCLNNYLGVRSIAEWVNDNPVFDAARRLSRDHCRITRRQQLVSYEVAGGKAILRFKRFAQYPGIDGAEIRADCFANIAPPIDPLTSGDLIDGETYIVRGSGHIVYRGGNYAQDQTITATAEKEFGIVGDANLYVHDGIRHAALRKGFTNEWTMFVEPRCYHPSESSIWKPAAYSDYFAFCDRCHFYSGTAQTALRRFATFNHTTDLDPTTYQPILNPISLQAAMLNPETPDQFRYAANANRTFGSADFYSSCQVYNRPYEIESCTIDDWSTEQVIKITLTGRLRSHPNAPSTVAADPATWSAGDVTALRNSGGTPEDYRTDDNAVREYVLSEADGNYPCVFRTGDAGTGSAVTGLTDNPFGSCYPVFFFGRLIPEPYDDGNDVSELHDSRCLVDSMLHMEVALRSMCEGFVDARTSKDIICETGLGNLYDYTFENLCFEAFGGRWINAFELAAREDNPAGFGPLPNTKMYAEVFNRFVACVNLLDKVRFDVPVSFQAQEHYYRDDYSVSLTELDGTTCTTAGTCRAYGDGLGVPPAGTPAGAPSGWFPWTTIGASKSGQLVGCPYAMASIRTDTEYRVEIAPAFVNAIPTELQELVDLGQTGFLAIRTTELLRDRREVVAEVDGDRCPTTPPGGPAFWFDGAGEYYRWVTNNIDPTVECVLVSSGILEAPGVPSSDYKIGRTPPLPAGGFCGNNATSGVRLDLIAEQGAFIQVPLV